MPWVLHILRWSIIGLRCFFRLICICISIIAVLAIIPVDITCSQVKPLEFSHRGLSVAGGVDGIALIASLTILFEIPGASCNPEMQFVIRAIVVYPDVWVSPSDLTRLKRHFGRRIVKKDSIVHTHCFRADHDGRRWVLSLLDLTLHCSKSDVIHPVLVALRWCVPGIHQECVCVRDARRG